MALIRAMDRLVAAGRAARLDVPARVAMRQAEARPLADELRRWLATVDPPGRAPLYEAVTYARKQWSGLLVFLERPKLTLDNNGAERRQRAVAQGRRSWSSRAPTAALSRPPPCSRSSAPARSSASTPTGGSATRSMRRPPFVRASPGLPLPPRPDPSEPPLPPPGRSSVPAPDAGARRCHGASGGLAVMKTLVTRKSTLSTLTACSLSSLLW
jgi:hypothetical protein